MLVFAEVVETCGRVTTATSDTALPVPAPVDEA